MQNRNTPIDTILTVARWEGQLGGWVKKMKGLRSTNWYLQFNEDVKYSTGNIVKNIITVYGVRWVLGFWG